MRPGASVSVGLLVMTMIVAGCGRDLRPRVTDGIATRVAGAKPTSVPAASWNDVVTFYEARAHAPAWTSRDAPSRMAREALSVLATAPGHGLDASRYRLDELAESHARFEDEDDAPEDSPDERAAALADFDVALTGALLALGRDVALATAAQGNTAGPGRTPPDFPTSLAAVLDDGRLAEWLTDVQPTHRGYAALQQALVEFRLANAEGPGPEVDARIRQIGQNLARWRALPDELGDAHVLVNVPAFELAVRDGDREVLTMPVIVGAPGTKTPLFSDTMESVVFSPYWHIPESIAIGETAPEVASDPDYLRRQRIEVVRRSADGGAERVDPADVDWDDPEEVSELALRQRPGPGNALGLVKFLFPNRHAVYLHDTSARALFEQPARALSHGCVRVGEPAALAEFVLGKAPEWTAERIEQAMQAGEERHVALDRLVQVHLTYFTAEAGADGRLIFHPDVYDYDR